MRHAALDGAEAAPGVEPGTERAEYGEIRVDARSLKRDGGAGDRGGLAS